MSYSVLMAKNLIASGSNENEFIVRPRKIRTGKIGCVLFHGAGTTSMGISSSGWPDLMRMVAAIANAGIPIAYPSNNVDNYANDTAMTRIDQSITALAGLGCDATKVHLIGASMGGGTIARYAGLNPSKAASVNAIIPMSSMVNLYQGKWGPGTPSGSELNSFVAPLATAWSLTSHAATLSLTSGSPDVVLTAGTVDSTDVGKTISFTSTGIAVVQAVTDATHMTMDRNAGVTGSYTVNIYQALPAEADIASAVAGANGLVPGRLFYADGDPYIKPTDVQAVATAAGWEANALVGTSHSNGAAAAWRAWNGGTEFSDLISYLIARGA